MYSVLIAEDEVLIQAGIQASIPWNQLDMQVIACCSDGEAAWQVCQQEKPDIIITDIRMPRMDGLTLTRHIRECNQRSRIIIITCVEDFSIIKDILDKDITAYLLKATMTTEDILNTLRKAKKQLDSNRSALAEVSNDRHSLRDLLRAYVLEQTISCREFTRRLAGLQLSDGRFGSMMLIGFQQSIDANALCAIRKVIEKRLRILGTCILLGTSNGLFVLAPQRVEAPLLRSCFSGIAAALQESLDLSVHAAVYSGELTADTISSVFQNCRQLLESPYFYPDEYYDLASRDASNPSSVREMVMRFSEHPVCKGLIQVGSKKLMLSLQELQQAFAVDKNAFVDALCSAADILSLHLSLPDTLHGELRSAGSAAAAAELLYEKLPPCEHHTLYSREISSAVEFLCSNFTQRAVKLSDLAERSNFSVGYFSLLFRKNTGMSFTDYLTILRMEKARELLETTNLSVRQVSDSCGFTAVSYFTRYFNQKAHCSPKEWRKRHCAK